MKDEKADYEFGIAIMIPKPLRTLLPITRPLFPV